MTPDRLPLIPSTPEPDPVAPEPQPVVQTLTVHGTMGRDTLFTSNRDEEIWVKAGHDHVNALSGHDQIFCR